MRPRSLRWLMLGSLCLSGCVYYNGMYNTRKFTDQAEKAEREGRTIDANTAWGQVTIKAETLLTRHPETRYAPEARVLMGRAYAKLGDCTSARPALESSLQVIRDTALRASGELSLAQCMIKLDEPARAAEIYRSLYASAPDSIRRALRPELVDALRRAGAFREALALVGESGSGMEHQRLLLLAGAGDFDQAAALADSLATLGDTLAPWDSAAVLAGRQDPAAGSRIVSAALSIPARSNAQRANSLLNDAERLAPVDSRAAMERLRQVIAVGEPRDLVARARLNMLRLELASADDPAALDSLGAALERENTEGSPIAFDAEALAVSVRELIAVRDSVTPETPQGDMRVFLAGELARDHLRAPALARLFLVRVADVWPESPYAAKALLAARLMAPADSALRDRIATAYDLSPYVMALRGDEVPELRALEDSLGAFASAQSVRHTGAPDRRGRPAITPSRPGQRPAPGQRVPEIR